MGNTAVGFLTQEVSVFTGQALVTVAAKAGLAVGCALPASLLVGMVVARGAAGDTDPAWWHVGKKEGGVSHDPVFSILLERRASSHPRSPNPF